jgi:hypothetical protein
LESSDIQVPLPNVVGVVGARTLKSQSAAYPAAVELFLHSDLRKLEMPEKETCPSGVGSSHALRSPFAKSSLSAGACIMRAIADVITPPSRPPAAVPLAEAWAFGPSADAIAAFKGKKRFHFGASIVTFVGIVGITLRGFQSLLFGWTQGGHDAMHRIHMLGWGTFAVIILSTGALAQLRAPERNVVAMKQLLLGLAAGGVCIALARGPSGAHLILGAALGIPVALMVVTHPARAQLLHLGRIDPILAGLALGATVPLAWFAYTQIELQRSDAVSPHGLQFHWATMATMALAIALIAVLGSLVAPGWRVAAWSAGVAGAVFGFASIAFPEYASSVGRAWGAAGIAMAIVFVAAAEWRAKSTRMVGS